MHLLCAFIGNKLLQRTLRKQDQWTGCLVYCPVCNEVRQNRHGPLLYWGAMLWSQQCCDNFSLSTGGFQSFLTTRHKQMARGGSIAVVLPLSSNFLRSVCLRRRSCVFCHRFPAQSGAYRLRWKPQTHTTTTIAIRHQVPYLCTCHWHGATIGTG